VYWKSKAPTRMNPLSSMKVDRASWPSTILSHSTVSAFFIQNYVIGIDKIDT
jgi:hypothetical protein